LNILLVRKKDCPYSQNAMDFLLQTDHKVGVIECEKRFDQFPKNLGWIPDVVFSFKNYMVLPKSMTNTTICINFHPAPPEHPGSCSTNWAIYNNDTHFGVTAHFMNDLIDNGLIFRVKRFPIQVGCTLDELTVRADTECLKLFKEVVKDMTCTWKGKPRRGKDLDLLIKNANTPQEKLRVERATVREKSVVR
tara:strand:- start:93 stop:668 length:576 start_codon:yes stop_codon:yes gene_type:complete